MGKKKWHVRPISEADKAAGERLLKKFAPVNKTNARLQREIARFMQMNNLTNMDDAIVPLIGQMSRKLKMSSVKNYARKMLTGHARTPKIRRMMKALNKAAARAPKRIAKHLTIDDALQCLIRFPPDRWKVRECLELMLRTGLRAIDISHLKSKDIRFNQVGITVTLRAGKGVQGEIDVRTGRFRYEEFFGEATTRLRRAFQQESQPFKETNVDDVNRRLREVVGSKGSNRCVTSYSFRRIFLRRAMDLCDNDFKAAALKYSLHRDWRMLQAFYDDANRVLK
jgi:integrase